MNNGTQKGPPRNADGTRTSLVHAAGNQQTQIYHRKSDGTSLLQLDYESALIVPASGLRGRLGEATGG